VSSVLHCAYQQFSTTQRSRIVCLTQTGDRARNLRINPVRRRVGPRLAHCLRAASNCSPSSRAGASGSRESFRRLWGVAGRMLEHSKVRLARIAARRRAHAPAVKPLTASKRIRCSSLFLQSARWARRGSPPVLPHTIYRIGCRRAVPSNRRGLDGHPKTPVRFWHKTAQAIRSS
jgi:hypothetical protein